LVVAFHRSCARGRSASGLGFVWSWPRGKARALLYIAPQGRKPATANLVVSRKVTTVQRTGLGLRVQYRADVPGKNLPGRIAWATSTAEAIGSLGSSGGITGWYTTLPEKNRRSCHQCGRADRGNNRSKITVILDDVGGTAASFTFFRVVCTKRLANFATKQNFSWLISLSFLQQCLQINCNDPL
jgi:hypothetical protein